MATLAEVVFAVTFGRPDTKNLTAAERQAADAQRRIRDAANKHFAEERAMRSRIAAEVKRDADREVAARKRVADAVKAGVDAAAKADADSRAKILAGWRSTAKSIGAALAAGIGAAIGGATGVFALVDRQTAQYDRLAKDARASGLSGGAYQRLSFAARRGGASQEQLGAGFRFYNKQLQDSKRGAGGDALRGALGGIGLSVRELATMKPEEQLGAIADGLNSIADPAERAARLAAIFGEEAGPKLASTLAGGSKGLREVGDEAERLGIVLGDDALASAEALQDGITDLKGQLGGLLAQGIGALIPVVGEYVEQAKAWVASNRELLGQKVREYAKQLVDLFRDLVAILRTVITVGGKIVDMFGGIENTVTIAVTAVAAFKFAMLGLPGVVAGVSVAVGLALGSMISDLAGFTEEIRRARAEADEFRSQASVSKKGRTALERLQELTREGQIGTISQDEYNALASDLVQSGRQNGNEQQALAALNLYDRVRVRAVNKATATANRRESQEGGTAFAKSGRALKTGSKRGGAKSQDEILIDEFDIDELFGGEIRRLAARDDLGEIAIQAALEAGAASLREGSTKGVARNAALSRLGGYSGRDLTVNQRDPLLSELLGQDVPDVELSAIARGAQPQTLISTINNTFNFDNDFQVSGAGEPGNVAEQIASQLRETFQGALAASTKTAKVVFAR